LQAAHDVVQRILRLLQRRLHHPGHLQGGRVRRPSLRRDAVLRARRRVRLERQLLQRPPLRAEPGPWRDSPLRLRSKLVRAGVWHVHDRRRLLPRRDLRGAAREHAGGVQPVQPARRRTRRLHRRGRHVRPLRPAVQGRLRLLQRRAVHEPLRAALRRGADGVHLPLQLVMAPSTPDRRRIAPVPVSAPLNLGRPQPGRGVRGSRSATGGDTARMVRADGCAAEVPSACREETAPAIAERRCIQARALDTLGPAPP
jgi:hypothetical protein